MRGRAGSGRRAEALARVLVGVCPGVSGAGRRDSGRRLADFLRLGRLGVEGGDADQVVGGTGEEEPGPVALSPLVAELASAGNGLDPAEGFLDAGSDPLAGAMPRVAGRAPIDG